MINSPLVARLNALYDEQLAICRQLGYGGLWRRNDRLDRLGLIRAALHELWELRRQEDALRRAGGRPRCLGPADGKAHRSRRII